MLSNGIAQRRLTMSQATEAITIEQPATLHWPNVGWVAGLLLVLLVTVVAATHARYRIDQAIRYFAGLLAAAFAALVLAGYGH